MKIGMNVNKVINVYNNNSKVDMVKKPAAQKRDTIEISPEVKEISKYVEMAKTTEIRTKRINEIKELIDNGKYNVDSKKLAKSILDHIKGSDI